MAKAGSLCVTLNNGVFMPVVGLGTYGLNGDSASSSCQAAATAGYRHFDTAFIYGNEADIGNALGVCRELCGKSSVSPPASEFVKSIKGAKWVTDEMMTENKKKVPQSSNLKYDDPIFVTTKVWVTDFGYDKTRASVMRSMERLQMDKLDLVLMHWPSDPSGDIKNKDENLVRHETWRALEDLYAENKIRAIGVSNFTFKHLFELISFVDEQKQKGVKNAINPMANQMEVNPTCHPPKELVSLCDQNKIRLISYSTLGSEKGVQKVMNNKSIQEISKQHKKEPAQVCLRWCIQSGVSVIPRSSQPQRVISNFDIFDFSLTDEEMKKIENENIQARFCPDPNALP